MEILGQNCCSKSWSEVLGFKHRRKTLNNDDTKITTLDNEMKDNNQ